LSADDIVPDKGLFGWEFALVYTILQFDEKSWTVLIPMQTTTPNAFTIFLESAYKEKAYPNGKP